MQNIGRRMIGRYGKVVGVCLAAALLATAGCEESKSKKAALTDQEIRRLTLAQKPVPPDHLIVCGETITWDDVLASLPDDTPAEAPLKGTLEKNAREMSLQRFLVEGQPLIYQKLRRRIEGIVLSMQARRELGDKVNEKLDEYTEREWRRFVLEEHGGNEAAADEALQEAGMSRITYKQWRKKKILANYLVESRLQRDRPITYNELLARYNEVKDKEFAQEAVLQFRLIDVDVAKVAEEHPNEDPRQKAEDLRKRIDAGEDFAEVAKRYSQGLRRNEGGLWPARDPNALAAPYDVLVKQAQDMEPGQVAGPLAVPGHFFLMKIEQKRPRSYLPLDQVQDKVRKDILENRWVTVFDELETEIRQQVDVADTSEFVAYCLERFYRQAHTSENG